MKLIMENWRKYQLSEGATSIHLSKKGENLTNIAKEYGISLKDLILINPEIEDPDLILTGQKIKIPDQEHKTDPNIEIEEETLEDLISRVSEYVNDIMRESYPQWRPHLEDLQKQILLHKRAQKEKLESSKLREVESYLNESLKAFYNRFYNVSYGIINKYAKREIDETLLTPREQIRLETYKNPNAWSSLLGGLAIIKIGVLASPSLQPTLADGAIAMAMGIKKGWFEEYDLVSYADADLFQPFREKAIAKVQQRLNTVSPDGRTLASRLLKLPSTDIATSLSR
jgi:LysM repeat protein